MVKYLATEQDGIITVHQMKWKKPFLLGSFRRSKGMKDIKVEEITNIFLSSLKHIPTNWSKTDGTINPALGMYGTKYTIVSSAQNL